MSGNTGLTPRAEEIVEVATRLFAEAGYRAVGLRSIAEEVGVRPASLYHHFPSKAKLLYAICLGTTRDFIDSHLPILDEPGPVSDRLRRLITAHIRYFWNQRLQEQVALREMRELDPEDFEDVRSHRRRYQNRIREEIDRANAAGELHVADAGLATMAMLDMINGINAWFRPGHGYTIDEVADIYADQVVYGLLGAGCEQASDRQRADRAGGGRTLPRPSRSREASGAGWSTT